MKTVTWGAVALFVLNVIDALSTYIGLSSGLMYEVNPIMLALWNAHPAVFLVTKVALGAIASFLFLRVDSSFARKALILCIAIYTAVLLSHVIQWGWYFLS